MKKKKWKNMNKISSVEAPGGGTPPTESFRAWGFWHHP